MEEVNEMQIKKAIIGAAAGLLVSGTLGGVALAASGDGAAKSETAVSQTVENSATDTDDVQEGDQTGPEEADANRRPRAKPPRAVRRPRARSRTVREVTRTRRATSTTSSKEKSDPTGRGRPPAAPASLWVMDWGS